MKEKAHFNPKSFTWIISLAIMIVLCVGVIFASKAIYNLANEKYNKPVEIGFTIASEEDMDISSMNKDNYGVTAVKGAYDAGGNLVAYIVSGTTTGYNTSVPIEMSTIISADGTLVCGMDILKQEETEYLGVRIETDAFKNQFEGRYLPVVKAGGTDKGSTIDVLSNSTISTQAVIDGVNNAQAFVCENFESAQVSE